MTRFTTLAAALLLATTAMAQTTPGEQFMQSWDLDGNATATLKELRQMRGNVFLTFDANEDGFLDADEYVLFDEARANDVANYEADERDQMQAVADGMSLSTSDKDDDSRVAREEFLAGAGEWFTQLDKNGDGGITLEDFAEQ